MTALTDLTMSQIATAYEALAGIPTTAKTFNTRAKAVSRLEALLAEKGLGIADALRAAGVEPIDGGLEQEVAAAEASFATPATEPAAEVPEEDDQPLDAAGILASETLANECRAILTTCFADVGLDADNAKAAAERAVRALPLPTKPGQPRGDGKMATVVAMLRRPEGATIDQICTAVGWQRHSVHGALAGHVKKKLGLNVVSEKAEGQKTRTYRIADAA